MFPSKRTGSENVFDILGTIFAIMFGNVGLHVPIVSIDPAGLMDLRVATTMTLLLKLASFVGERLVLEWEREWDRERECERLADADFFGAMMTDFINWKE